jgi:hypothetical protein
MGATSQAGEGLESAISGGQIRLSELEEEGKEGERPKGRGKGAGADR